MSTALLTVAVGAAFTAGVMFVLAVYDKPARRQWRAVAWLALLVAWIAYVRLIA